MARRVSSVVATFFGCVRLVHPFPVSVVLATSIILLAVARGGIPDLGLSVRAGLVVLLSQISVGALNDYVDRGEDARTQPDKPLPSGLVSPRLALGLSLTAAVLLLPVALTLGPWSAAIAGLGTGAGLAYDLWLKPTPLSFLAYVVAFLSLVTWVWLVSGQLKPAFVLVYPVGAAVLIAAHLANAFPDIESDRALGHRGLATLLGPRLTLLSITTLYALGALVGLALSLDTRTWLALLCDLVGAATILAAFLFGRRHLPDRRARKTVFRLVAPAVGLLAFGCLLAFTHFS